MSYDAETQQEDLAAINAAQQVLSAKLVGEKPASFKPDMATYARIAGYNKGLAVRHVARMFWALCEHQEIGGFELLQYENMLADMKKLVQHKLFRRRATLKPCLKPNEHLQRCSCGNLARAQAKQRGV